MRLLTHNDFDGMVCAVLITSMEDVVEIRFVDPRTLQRRKIQISEDDIIADLPFHPACALWFDHHASNKTDKPFEGAFELAPSAARVVFNYYENPMLERFRPLLEAADRIDSGNLVLEDVLNPKGYGLLSTTLESENRYADDNYRRKVIEWLKKKTLEEILELPEVKERIEKRRQEVERFRQEIPKHARVEGNVLVLDARGKQELPNVGSYMLYALYPQCNISMKIFDMSDKELMGVSVGKNIFNNTSKIDIGALMKKYKGGGHPSAGGCSFERRVADEKIAGILNALKE